MLLIRQVLVGILIGALVAPAVWAADADNNSLVIGVFPRQKTTTTFKCFTPLAQYLSQVLHRNVILETAPDYATFMSELNTSRYDIVHFNQYHYVRAHKTLGYEVIAMNEENGSGTIQGTIAVSAKSGVQNVQQLRNSKIVFGGGPEAMMSYVVPTFLLRSAGLQQGDYHEEFAKNPVNALLAVYYGQAQAAGVGKLAEQLPDLTEQYENHGYTYLVVSEPLAHLPWAVKATMPEDLSQQIQAALIALKHTEQGRRILDEANLTGLLPAKDADYNRHRQIIATILGERY